MSEFIKLTRAYDQKKVGVNMDQAKLLIPLSVEDKGTVVMFGDNHSLEVTETMDQIIEKINKADQT